jgi:hypothetical protein
MWGLPTTFLRAGLHALVKEICFNIPSSWEDLCGSRYDHGRKS